MTTALKTPTLWRAGFLGRKPGSTCGHYRVVDLAEGDTLQEAIADLNRRWGSILQLSIAKVEPQPPVVAHAESDLEF